MSTAIALVLGGQAHAAGDDWHQLMTSGYWGTYVGSDSRGQKMCEVETRGERFMFMLKYASGKIFFHFFNVDWNIPGHRKVSVNVQIDTVPMTVPMYGNDNTHVLEYMVPEGKRPDGQYWFLYLADLISEGTQMYVSFPEGSTPRWNINLMGSREAMKMFVRCIYAVAGGTGTAASGQPYGSTPSPQASGQPFSSGDEVINPQYQYRQ